MKRFLATTAMALALAMPAAAQTTNQQTYLQQAEEGDIRSSEFVGMRVYTSEADIDPDGEIGEESRAEWQDVGEINDVLMTRDGSVKAILVDVGGFLGMGEKTVAIEMEELQFLTVEGDAEEFLVFKGSREALEAAPEFQEREMERAAADGAEVTGGASTTGAASSTDEVPVTVTERSRSETALEETADDAGAAVENAAESTAAAASDAAEETEQALENAADAVEEEADEARIRAEADGGAVTMQREGWTETDAGALTAEELEGAEVYDANDEAIGEVSQLILSDDGRVSEAVIEVGGFLGLGAHQVAMPFQNLHVMREGEGQALRVYVDVSKAELEAMPAHEG